MVKAASWARPGGGKRCARASPSRLALRARDLGFALAICATRSRLGTTMKWIHLLQLNEFIEFCTAKINEFICKIDEFICKIDEFICKNWWIHLQKSMNSFLKWIHWWMNSLISKRKKIVLGFEPRSYYQFTLSHNTNSWLNTIVFLQYKYCF